MDDTDDIFNDEKKISVTYKMYHSIWSLQRFFNNPSYLFDQNEWLKFEKSAEFVVNLFQDYAIF